MIHNVLVLFFILNYSFPLLMLPSHSTLYYSKSLPNQQRLLSYNNIKYPSTISSSISQRLLPNVIMVYSKPHLYNQILSATYYSSFKLIGINISSTNLVNYQGIVSQLNKSYNCGTMGIIGYCEHPKIMYLLQMWAEEKRVYFVSYSCDKNGPFATVNNLVFQLDPGMNVYTVALLNTIRMGRFSQNIGFQLSLATVGIILNSDNPQAVYLYRLLRKALIDEVDLAFTIEISQSSQLFTQTLKRLQYTMAYAVSFTLVITDSNHFFRLLQMSIDMNVKMFNSGSTFMLTDVGEDLTLQMSTRLLKLCSTVNINLLYLKRYFGSPLLSDYYNVDMSIIRHIKLMFNSMQRFSHQNTCLNKLSKQMVTDIFNETFFSDGALIKGDVGLFRLTKRILLHQNGTTVNQVSGEWFRCRSWSIDHAAVQEILQPVTICDEIISSLRLPKRELKIVIQQQYSILQAWPYDTINSPHSLPCFQLSGLKRGQKVQYQCSGQAVSLLDMLAHYLNATFTIYFVDRRYTLDMFADNVNRGLYTNNNETGTQVSIAIHIVLLQALQHPQMYLTTPFYFSEYALLTDLHSPGQLLGAAFQPFTLSVWLMICLIATLCAVAMALYEWHSPFGLNPHGRRRGTNYSLASAVTSVWAMLFGHTIHTKAPKSWPVKVLKNFWACACIVIVAMYTANLTVFIAGILQNNLCYYYQEGKFKVAIKRSLRAISKKLRYNNCLNFTSNSLVFVDNDDEAYHLFLNRTVQILIGERHDLESFRFSRELCKSEILPLRYNSFGFSFGFPLQSPLYNEVSQFLLEAQRSGYLDFLTKTYKDSSGDQKCSTTMKSQKGYSIANMLGCFLFMGVGFVVSLLVLFLEHLLFLFIVPRWRSLPDASAWKGFTMLFMSQRLYRVIHSERLIKPKETRQEMIAIVRNREFHKMFFKENMHKPIPTRVTSPAKISVYDISSEMVKLKRKSIESLAAIEGSFDDEMYQSPESNVKEFGSHNTNLSVDIPLISCDDDDDDFTLSNSSQTQTHSQSQDSKSPIPHNNSWKASHSKCQRNRFVLTSRDSSTSSGSTKKKYSKNPKLYSKNIIMLTTNQRQKALARMPCLDNDDGEV